MEFPYRRRKWQLICSLVLVTAGGLAAAAAGIYLYGGGDFGKPDVLVGKSGAVILWIYAGLAAAVDALLIWIFRAVARKQPRVVLEEGAITVPSKWRMEPVRIALSDVMSVEWGGSGKMICLWLHTQRGKFAIYEYCLEPGSTVLIAEWIEARREQ
jgi:hypothetical protein